MDKNLRNKYNRVKSLYNNQIVITDEYRAKIQSQQEEIERLKNVESLLRMANTDFEEENQNLKEIIKEAINLPKGIEPHSYSDYKQKLNN